MYYILKKKKNLRALTFIVFADKMPSTVAFSPNDESKLVEWLKNIASLWDLNNGRYHRRDLEAKRRMKLLPKQTCFSSVTGCYPAFSAHVGEARSRA